MSNTPNIPLPIPYQIVGSSAPALSLSASAFVLAADEGAEVCGEELGVLVGTVTAGGGASEGISVV